MTCRHCNAAINPELDEWLSLPSGRVLCIRCGMAEVLHERCPGCGCRWSMIRATRHDAPRLAAQIAGGHE